jgi:hypothetical protein
VVSISSYDNANRLTGNSHVKSGTTLASASYTVDAVGNRSDRTDLAGMTSVRVWCGRLGRRTVAGPRSRLAWTPASPSLRASHSPSGRFSMACTSSIRLANAWDEAPHLPFATAVGERSPQPGISNAAAAGLQTRQHSLGTFQFTEANSSVIGAGIRRARRRGGRVRW